MKNTKCDGAVHVRLPSELIEKLKKMAAKARRDLSNYIRVTLEDHAEANTDR